MAPAPERPYVEELDAEPGRLRIGFMEQPAVSGLESDPECVAAVREAAALLESLGHEVEDSSPLDPGLAEALDLEDTFMTRWAAGQAATLDQLGMLLGREVRRDEVEPLTWALAEVGRERSAGRYLRDVAVHQTVAGRSPAWHEAGLRPAADADAGRAAGRRSAPTTTGLDDPLDAFARAVPAGAFTAIFNVTGQPAASLPLHWTEAGLPIGIQLVGAVRREDDPDPGRARSSSRRARGRIALPPSSPLAILRPMPEIRGVITAMVTPFADDGALDLDAARRLAAPPGRATARTGSSSPGPPASRRRSPTTRSSRCSTRVLDEVGDRATVIAGTGSNDTRHTVELTAQGGRGRRPRGAGRHALLQQAEPAPACWPTSPRSPRRPARRRSSSTTSPRAA